jgi:hypothetical protein
LESIALDRKFAFLGELGLTEVESPPASDTERAISKLMCTTAASRSRSAMRVPAGEARARLASFGTSFFFGRNLQRIKFCEQFADTFGEIHVHIPRSFVLGLFAYVRQAALSLDRAPKPVGKAMCDFYEEHKLPSPAQVIENVDAIAKPHQSIPRGWILALKARLHKDPIRLREEELGAVLSALRGLESVLETSIGEDDAERVQIRLALSRSEELLRRKLGRFEDEVREVEHLNAASHLCLKPLKELVDPKWPALSWRTHSGTSTS